MARLLKVRGTRHDPDDVFESLLLLSLRGPVVFEGLWNDEIEFTDPQWKQLVENQYDTDQRAEGVLMQALAKMPIYILRGRKVITGQCIDSTLAQEISNIYHQLIEDQEMLRGRLENLDRKIECAGPEAKLLGELRDSATRIYSFQFAVIIIAGCVLGVVSGFTPELQRVLNWCAGKIYSYVPFCQQWRPLGSSYMLLAISMAWLATDNLDLRQKLENAYVEQHRDFPSMHSADSLVESLEACKTRFLSFGVKLPGRDTDKEPANAEYLAAWG